MNRSGAPLYALALGLGSGIFSAFVFGWGTAAALVLICAACAFLCCFRIAGVQVLVAALFLAAASIGIVRAEAKIWSESQDTLVRFTDRFVTAEGRVATDPDKRRTAVFLTVDVSSVNGTPARGRLLAEVPPNESPSYGDTVIVRGGLKEPQSFTGDTGREFDYPGYLRVRGVSAVMRNARMTEGAPAGFSVLGFLFSMKHGFEHSLASVFTEPKNALLQGILLGERGGLPQKLSDAFVVSGLVHIVVLSGSNIAIVAEAVLRFLSFLPKAASFSVGGIAMVLFALTVGGGATTMRALIMALIAMLARFLGRPRLALRALAVAIICMLLWNPLSLVYDISFLLSVCATLGLILLSPFVEHWVKRVPFLGGESIRPIREIVIATISVELFILPLLLDFSGILSFVSLPANVLVLPAIPFAMLFGFIAGVFGLVSPLLAYIPAALAGALLQFVIFIAEHAAALPLSSVVVPPFPRWIATAVYVPLTLFALWSYKKYSAHSE